MHTGNDDDDDENNYDDEITAASFKNYWGLMLLHSGPDLDWIIANACPYQVVIIFSKMTNVSRLGLLLWVALNFLLSCL